jgi:uncharacterized Zn-finger protein
LLAYLKMVPSRQYQTSSCHLLECIEKKPYICQDCFKQFVFAWSLRKHAKKHGNECSRKSRICTSTCPQNIQLEIHLKGHGTQKHHSCRKSAKTTFSVQSWTEKSHCCITCSKAFATNKLLHRHMRIHATVKPYNCLECDKAFSWAWSLRQHMRSHTGEKPFKCDQCFKEFSGLCDLKRHIRYHVGEKPYKCKDCGKPFSDSGHLKEHMTMHTGEKPFLCNVCAQSFRLLSGLKRHTKRHSDNRKLYDCKQCMKQFSDSAGLKTHVRIHSGEKPFTCSQCSRQYISRKSLKSHLLSHSGERPFKCDKCCKDYARIGELNRHIKIHSRRKLFCKMCQEQFEDENLLKLHRRDHCVSREFNCQLCSNHFRKLRELKKHVAVHENEKKLKSSLCSEIFQSLTATGEGSQVILSATAIINNNKQHEHQSLTSHNWNKKNDEAAECISRKDSSHCGEKMAVGDNCPVPVGHSVVSTMLFTSSHDQQLAMIPVQCNTPDTEVEAVNCFPMKVSADIEFESGSSVPAGGLDSSCVSSLQMSLLPRYCSLLYFIQF